MFTDIVASTEMAERLGPEKADTMRRDHFTMLRELVAMHGGHEVKSLGDGLMVAFASAADAVSCATAIHGATTQKQQAELDAPAVRIGVHTGEPTLEDGDYFGLCVVVAKRLCDALGGAGVLVSDAVRSLTAQAVPPEHRRELNLKGFAEPTVAWQLV
jgi:class 3 adenylate cyclase